MSPFVVSHVCGSHHTASLSPKLMKIFLIIKNMCLEFEESKDEDYITLGEWLIGIF